MYRALPLLLKGKDQYNWPPCTNKFRSTAFYSENIIYLFYKTSYLNEEVNCTEPFPFYWRGKDSTINLLVLTSIYQLFFIYKRFYTFFTKQAMLMRRLTVLSPSLLLKGKDSTIDLIVLTSLEQLLFILKILFIFFTKQATLMRRSTVHSPFPSVSAPWISLKLRVWMWCHVI